MMQKNVFDQIEKIKVVVEQWNQINEIPDIERELVLDKLKNIYEDVMFMQRESVSDRPSTVVESGGEQILANEATFINPTAMPEVDLQLETEVEMQSSIVGKDEIAAGAESPIQEQVLFEHEPIARAQVDKKVILSLYGEPTAVSSHSGFKSSATGAGVSQSDGNQPVKPMYNQPKEVDAYRVNDAVAMDSGSHKKVLGEVLTSGNVAFNDLAGRQPHMDLASKIHAQSVVDLRQSIGINDKFTMIKDLFGGNATAYEDAITSLNQFTDIDEAMIYIQENYNWIPDSAGLNFLVDLLERKLS